MADNIAIMNTDAAKDATLLREAVAAFYAGKKDTARTLLSTAAGQNPENELVWLWRASLATSRREAVSHLQKVLKINPDNPKALAWMARIGKAAPKAKSAWNCILCGHSSNAKEDVCPNCGSILEFADLQAIAENTAVRAKLLQPAIERFEGILRKGPDLEAQRGLALAHLNLKNSAKAIHHLREACSLQPHDDLLRQRLDELLQRRLILVVDDSATVRKMVSLTLERERYRVETASDGMQALARLNEELPDLVLLDITMPRMDGYQVCRVIKKNDVTKDIPVIMLSGKDGFFDKVRGRMVGATEYVTKPFEADALIEAIAKRLEGGS